MRRMQRQLRKLQRMPEELIISENEFNALMVKEKSKI